MDRSRTAARSVVIGAAVLAALLLSATHVQEVFAQTTGSIASLRAQLDDLNAKATAYQSQIQNLENQKASLNRDVSILNAQIAQAKLEIQRRNITIASLSADIQQKEDNIIGLNDKLQSEYKSLAGIMRETDMLDKTSVVIAALTSTSISDFFADIDQFSAVNESMQHSFTDIQTDTKLNQQQKADLESQLQEETQLRQVQQLQQQQLQAREDQQKQLIADTQGKESNYQTLLSQNRKSAAQIQAALFQLAGGGNAKIPFSQALQYANLAAQKTGIRPAFLLGIIAEESNLGQNVGTGTWLVDMNPTRDAPIFRAITQSLGIDPNSMPVSKKAWYGWGGAMGPAQFIPSTWAMYAGYTASSGYTYDPSKDRIGKLTGNKPPNPWSPADAFMAAALYLTDSGADKQTPSAEFRAAQCYLAGCGSANKADLQFYGRQAASLATQYQCQIDVINGNPNSSACASSNY